MGRREMLINRCMGALRQLDTTTRLEFLLGGVVATGDELGLTEPRLLAFVRTAFAQRAAALARARLGAGLVAPDGTPVTADTIPSGAPDEVSGDVGAATLGMLARYRADEAHPLGECASEVCGWCEEGRRLKAAQAVDTGLQDPD